MKKIYVASRYAHKKLVGELTRKLEQKGYVSVSHWIAGQSIPKPYHQDAEIAKSEAINAVNGSLECDVFVLISDEAGTGMYVEFGIALGRAARDPNVEIFVVGPWGASSIFTYHPKVVWLKSTAELLARL